MNKKILTGLGVAGVAVGGYFLYKKLKDHSDCMKFVTGLEWSSDYAKDFCKNKNWKQVSLSAASSYSTPQQ